MSSAKQQGAVPDLVAVVDEVRYWENIFTLFRETFYKQTGLFITGYGRPAEYTYKEYVDYLAELKRNIDTLKGLTGFLNDKAEKRENSEGSS